jgi:hypothetical protein
MLTLDILKLRLIYDEDTGLFIWNVPIFKNKKGKVAGSLTQNGRVQLTVEGKRYYAHQLAWFYVTGEYPTTTIRHKDGDQTNNRFSNLTKDIDCNVLLTQELLQSLFNYDKDTGLLTRKVTAGSNAIEGTVAGHVHAKRGYVTIILNGQSYSAHRLIWLYMTGDNLPETTHIDHVNGNKSDNRWDNLRLATRSENNSNVKLRADNTSGVKGLRISSKCIECRIAFNRKTYYKCFKLDEIEEAKTWLEVTRATIHGEFANNG